MRGITSPTIARSPQIGPTPPPKPALEPRDDSEPLPDPDPRLPQAATSRSAAAAAHQPLPLRPKSGAAVSWPASMMPRRMARVRVK